MKHSFFPHLFSIAIIAVASDGALSGAAAQAISKATNVPIAERVVRLESPSGGCASGVLIDPSHVLTNAHAVTLFCPYGSCDALTIAPDTLAVYDAPVPPVELTVERVEESMDLAVLSLTPPLPLDELKAIRFSAPTTSDVELTVVGYPACGARSTLRGRVSELTTLTMSTTAQGNFGSSGSLIVDSHQQPVGVVTQADSPTEAAASAIFRTPFSLRAIRGDVVQRTVLAPPMESCRSQVELLNTYFERDLLGFHALRRTLSALELEGRVRALRRCATGLNVDPTVTQSLLGLGEYPATPLTRPLPPRPSPLGLELEILVLRANLERHGVYRALFHPLAPDSLAAMLQGDVIRPEAHRAHLVETVRRAHTTGYVGIDLFTLAWGSLAALLALIIAAVWGFSGGVVYLTVQGTRTVRATKTVAALLLAWPVSLLFVVGAKLRRQRRLQRGK